MSYTKQNFIDGQVLNASQLNRIEDGIIANENAIESRQGKLTAGTNVTIDENNVISVDSTSSDNAYVTIMKNSLGLSNIDSTITEIDRPLNLNEIETYEGYIASDGKTLQPLNTYVTFVINAQSTIKDYSFNTNKSSYELFRVFITDASPINGTVISQQGVQITDSKSLTISIESGKYLVLTIKKQSVDTIETAFSNILLTCHEMAVVPVTDVQFTPLGYYNVTYDNDVLMIDGNGISCTFSKKTFSNTDGLFELQNLSYKKDVIFGTENDYIGPIRLVGGEIIGGKHGHETTDNIIITTDTGAIASGYTGVSKAVNIYVESTIANVISRISIYTFIDNKLTTESYIKTLTDNNFNRIWCCGLLSVENSNVQYWLSKDKLNESLSGETSMLDKCIVVCNKFNLFSNMIWRESPVGIKYKEFISYSDRKKWYNYNLYGTQEVPKDTVFSSCNELTFN